MVQKLQKGRTINYSAIGKHVSNLRYIDQELQKAGYGYIQRLAILGNVQRESSGNPLAVSSNGLWHGIIQWDKDRYRIQSDNAQEELKRQTALLIKELEKNGWSGWTWKDQLNYASSFKDSTDLHEAVDIFTRRFVRPKDINNEIKLRYNFANSGMMIEDDPEYDMETAKKVLPPELIKAWQNDPEKNHLPTGYTDEDGKYHYLKSSQHESYPESLEFERIDPETNRMMSRYIKPDNSVEKFLTYTPATSGLPESVSSLSFNPFISKKQEGGVFMPFGLNEQHDDSFVYNPFIYENEYEQSYRIHDEMKDSVLKHPSYRVEPVRDWDSIGFNYMNYYKESSDKKTPKNHYFSSNVTSVGKMMDFLQILSEEGIGLRITSGLRPNAKTRSGNRSRHADGLAVDVSPLEDADFEKLEYTIVNNPRIVQYMKDNHIRILKETSRRVMDATGATGKHFHISIGENFGKKFKDDVIAFDDDWLSIISNG